MNSFLTKLLNLIPIIAVGVNQVHGDLSLGSKLQLANDSLALAVAGATAVLSPTDGALAQSIGGSISSIMNTVVTAVHNGGTAAVASATPVAA